MKVEVDVLDVSNSPSDLRGRKATQKRNHVKTLGICVKVEVDVLGSPSLVLMVSVLVKQH